MSEFIPKVVRRERGDFVQSEEFNKLNRDLYHDYVELFEKEIALYARTKILSTMLEATNAGIQREVIANLDLPLVPWNSTFIYPDNAPRAAIDEFFGEITSGISSTQSAIVNPAGVKKPEIEISRSSDNLIFTRVPQSITETRVEDIIEIRELPWIMRIRGISEYTSVRLDIRSPFGTMDMNVLEFIPFPMVGGTEIRDFDASSADIPYGAVSDADDITFDFSRTASYYNRPMRFITSPKQLDRISLDFRSPLYIPSSDSIILGVTQVNVLGNVYQSTSYIGFIIPGQPGKKLAGVKPVRKWHNTYLGNIRFNVYRNVNSLKQISATIDGAFDIDGNGVPVSMDEDLYVLAIMETSINASCQLEGFTYEAVD